jgi:hypothetical protein
MELTALQVVNEVQRDLRLPQSIDFNNAHAKLILSYVNRVQRDIMAEACNWLDLKVRRQFLTVQGNSIYKLTRDELSKISYIGLGTTEITDCKTDEVFRSVKSVSEGQPAYYRIRAINKAKGTYDIEFNCPADAIYTVEYEGYAKPPLLEYENDLPVLNPETIVIGTILLAKSKQGQDVALELGLWKDNFSQVSADNNPGGDMDFL